MRKEYLEELEALKLQMEKAEAFAKRVPVFSEHILRYKITGEEDYHKFCDYYKQLSLGWGCNRGIWREGSMREVTNYPKGSGYNLFLWEIYINTLHILGDEAGVHRDDFSLLEYTKDVELFFFDKHNTKFYCTDENIGILLEALNRWCVDARASLRRFLLKQEAEKLEKQLQETKAEIEKERGVS